MYKPILFQTLRFFIVAIVFIVLCIVVTKSFAYLYPLVIAILLSALINPVVSILERKLKFPRMLAVTFIMIIIIATLGGILLFIFSELLQGTQFLADEIPQHFQTISLFVTDFINNTIIPLYQKIISYVRMLDTSQQLAISENIKQFVTNLTASGTTFVQDLLFKIPAFITSLPSSITVILFILLAVFLITNDYDSLKHLLKNLSPSFAKQPLANIARHLKRTISGYIKAQCILVLITALLVYVGLLLLNIEHAFTIALYSAMVDILPYIGSGIIFIPWMVYVFLIGNYSMTISLAILYGLIIIIRQFIEPKILASSMGLHPLAALITLFVGIQLWGVVGFILAPVFLIIINALHQAGTFQEILQFIKG